VTKGGGGSEAGKPMSLKVGVEDRRA